MPLAPLLPPSDHANAENAPPMQNVDRAADEATTTTNSAKLTQSKSKRRPEGARLSKQAVAEIKDLFMSCRKEGVKEVRVSTLLKELRKDAAVAEEVNKKVPGTLDALLTALQNYAALHKTLLWADMAPLFDEVDAFNVTATTPSTATATADTPVSPDVPSTATTTGLQYTFDGDTGILYNPGGGADAGKTLRMRYAERAAAGGFQRLYTATEGSAMSCMDRIYRLFGSSSTTHTRRPGSTYEEQGGGGLMLKSLTNTVGFWLDLTCIFSQGLLGGFALINLYMCYLLEPTTLPTGGTNSGFLHFYSPVAMVVQRTYYLLVTVSLLGAADKYTRDQMVGWHKLEFTRQTYDLAAVVLYALMLVLTIVASPFEDELYFTNRRVPGYWALSELNGDFNGRLDSYLAMNFVRQLVGGLAWVVAALRLQKGMDSSEGGQLVA